MADDLTRKLLEDLGEEPEAPLSFRRAITRYERERSPQALPQPGAAAGARIRRPFDEPARRSGGSAVQARAVRHARRPDARGFHRAGKAGAVAAHYDHQQTAADATPLSLPTTQRPIVYSFLGRHDHPESMVLNDRICSTTWSGSPGRVRPCPTPSVHVAGALHGLPLHGFRIHELVAAPAVEGARCDGRGEPQVSLALEDASSFSADLVQVATRVLRIRPAFTSRTDDWNSVAQKLADRFRQQVAEKVPTVPPLTRAHARPHAARQVFLAMPPKMRRRRRDSGRSLKLAELVVWQDKRNLRAGQYWEDQIARVIRASTTSCSCRHRTWTRGSTGERPAAFTTLGTRTGH